MIRIVRRLASAARRTLLGISPDEIRYTFEDVRRELRAARRDVELELEAIRKDFEELRSGRAVWLPGRDAIIGRASAWTR